MECQGFAVDAEWVTAMVAGWFVGGVVGIRYRRGPTGVRNDACRAQKGLLGYATHFQRHSVQKTGFCGTEGIFGTGNPLLRYGTVRR